MKTLVIAGELDDPELVAHAQDLSTNIGEAELVTIPGAGHMSPMEKSEEVTSTLEAFLASQ